MTVIRKEKTKANNKQTKQTNKEEWKAERKTKQKTNNNNIKLT